MPQSRRFSNVILGLVLGLLVLLLIQPFTTRTSTQNVLLGVIAGLMAVLTMQPARSMGSAVEYKLVPMGSLNQAALDEIGKEGWRLVCIDQPGNGYIFRR